MKYLKKFESHYSNFIIDTNIIKNSDQRGWNSINEILLQQNLKLDDFLEHIRTNLFHFGVSYPKTTFTLIGSGQYGIAFQFVDKVLKITTSAKEFVTCNQLVDLEYDGLVRYYLCFQYDNLPIWVIVQDKLQIPNKMERDIYTTLYYLGANDMENPNFEFDSVSSLVSELQSRLENPRPEDQLPSYQITRKDLYVYVDKYLDLVDRLKSQGITTDDLHGENLGIKEGELLHFDVMMV